MSDNIINLTIDDLRIITEMFINAPMPQPSGSMSHVEFYTHYLYNEIHKK